MRVVLIIAGLIFGAAPLRAANDPAAKISCLPSPECALQLARVYARAEAPAFNDPHHLPFSLTMLAWEMRDQGDLADLPAAVDEIIAEYRKSKQPMDVDDQISVAMLQADAGRQKAAHAMVAEIRDPAKRRDAVYGLTWQAIKQQRMADAFAAVQLLPADERQVMAVKLASRFWDDEDIATARLIVANLGVDLAKEPGLALQLKVTETGADRYVAAVKMLEQLPVPKAILTLRYTELPPVRSPEALPLLRFHRDLFAKAKQDIATEYECELLSERFADAGASDEADSLADLCKVRNIDDFRGRVSSSHAFAGKYAAAEAMAMRISDHHSRDEAQSYIAQARVQVGKQPADQAFAAVRDSFLRYERLSEIAEEYTLARRFDEARVILRLALLNAQRQRGDDRDECLSRIGESLSDIGFVADALPLLEQVTNPRSRAQLLSAIATAEFKAGNRRGAAARFVEAHEVAREAGFDDEESQNLVSWQASAGLTHEALAIAREMDTSTEDGRYAKQEALEAVIIAMAKRGELATAFATARSLESGRYLVFSRIYRALLEARRRPQS